MYSVTRNFKFTVIPSELSAVLGLSDPGTRIYRRQGAPHEMGLWYDALCERLPSKLVPLSEVPVYVPVSRAAVHKRLKTGGLTAFCFHVVPGQSSDRYGREREFRRTPYAYVPVDEAKAWAEELAVRANRFKSGMSASKSSDANGGVGIENANGSSVFRTLHDDVVSTITDLITEGVFAPGQRLTERILSERLKVSRTPLREAMKVLAQIGIVELLPNRGARVTKLTRNDVQHLFEVIGALEALSGSLAAERITPKEIAEIKAIHAEMARHYANGDLPAYFRSNQSIHEHIVRAARNPVLLTIYMALGIRLRRPRYLANANNKARWEAAMREHEEIIGALERRASEEVGRLLANHLHHKYEAVCRYI